MREVKQRLHRLHGLPPRFRQRLILQGSTLDDAEVLASSLDLELVVLLGWLWDVFRFQFALFGYARDPT